jgi:Rrf2 family protein
MYMVRHLTQLPVTVNVIAKAEGIPFGYLSKNFQKLIKANILKTSKGRKRGYVFAREPEEISLLELFEAIEGGPLFTDCFMKHCKCGGTPGNCSIYACWINSTRKIVDYLTDTSIVDAAWNHPEHRFYELPILE